jgi:hypothetical protein
MDVVSPPCEAAKDRMTPGMPQHDQRDFEIRGFARARFQCRALKRTDCGWVYSGTRIVKSHGETVGLIFEPGDARGELSEYDTGELDLIILGAHTIRPRSIRNH